MRKSLSQDLLRKLPNLRLYACRIILKGSIPSAIALVSLAMFLRQSSVPMNFSSHTCRGFYIYFDRIEFRAFLFLFLFFDKDVSSAVCRFVVFILLW